MTLFEINRGGSEIYALKEFSTLREFPKECCANIREERDYKVVHKFTFYLGHSIFVLSANFMFKKKKLKIKKPTLIIINKYYMIYN